MKGFGTRSTRKALWGWLRAHLTGKKNITWDTTRRSGWKYPRHSVRWESR